MFSGITSIIIEIIQSISSMIFYVFAMILPDQMTALEPIGFNIYLFSDSGWFTEPIPFMILISLIIVVLMFIFLIRLLWKGTKKFINMIFGVFKL